MQKVLGSSALREEPEIKKKSPGDYSGALPICAFWEYSQSQIEAG